MEIGMDDPRALEHLLVTRMVRFNATVQGIDLDAPPADARGGKHKGAGVGPSPAYSYSAAVAEVEVGRIREPTARELLVAILSAQLESLQ